MNSYLVTLIVSLLVSKYDFSQVRSLSILFSRVDWSSGLQVFSISESSGNMLVLHVSMTAGRSFKIKRKSNGPRIGPCGTPTVTGKGLEMFPLKITDCDHQVR